MKISEARQKLDLLELVNKNPELILTELFKESRDAINLIYRVVDDEHDSMRGYLLDCLKKISVFENCKLDLNGAILKVSVPVIETLSKQKTFSNGFDRIIEIELDNMTFYKNRDSIKQYEKVMNEVYTYNKIELSEWWKRFEDRSIRNRISLAFKELKTNHSLRIKIANFFFMLTMPKKLINKGLSDQKRRIEEDNRLLEAEYKRKIESQEVYKKEGPKQIERNQTQMEKISDYLFKLGYDVIDKGYY